MYTAKKRMYSASLAEYALLNTAEYALLRSTGTAAKGDVPASKLSSCNGRVEHLAKVLAALLAGAGVTVLRRWHM